MIEARAAITDLSLTWVMSGELPPVAMAPSWSGFWQYSTSDVIADPGSRHFRWDTITTPAAATHLAFSTIDQEGVDRTTALAGLAAGDVVAMRSTTVSGNWATFTITAVVNLTTWFRLDIANLDQGPNTSEPAGNDRVLFDFQHGPAAAAATPLVLSLDVTTVDTSWATVLYDYGDGFTDLRERASSASSHTYLADLQETTVRVAATLYGSDQTPLASAFGRLVVGIPGNGAFAMPTPGTLPPPTDEQIAFIRKMTGGAPDWSDEQLATLIEGWTCTTTDPVTGVQTVSYDLWAASALVIQQQLVAQSTSGAMAGVQETTSGDLTIKYGSGGAGGSLRFLMHNYWRRACPENRAMGEAYGWATVDIVPPQNWRLQTGYPGLVYPGGQPLPMAAGAAPPAQGVLYEEQIANLPEPD